jgi:hypothetical protein
MKDERRYDEGEVAAIFEAASNERGPAGRAPNPASGGLSLTELQEIGGQVGIAPARIAEAAAALDPRVDADPRRTHLGMPVSVGRTVDLPRAPTDREWEVLVGELRRTFHAQGRIADIGDLRGWTNGNLHAYVEPTDDGWQLRMGTLKSNGVAMGWLGIVALVAGLLALAFLFLGGEPEEGTLAVILAVLGGTALAANAIRLPRWASEREGQMERIASRAQALIRAPEPEPGA